MATVNNSQRRAGGPFFVAQKPVADVFGNHVLQGLLVRANTGLALAVTVESGVAVVSGKTIFVYQETYSLTAAHGSLDRKDLIQVGVGTRTKISVKPGTAAATPTAPNPDSECIPLAIVDVVANDTVLDYWNVNNDVRPILVGPQNW